MAVAGCMVHAPLAAQAPPPPEFEAQEDRRDLPPLIPEDDLAVPDITITPGETQTIREYRRGGRIYMIEVVPAAGPSYFLVDTTGDGTFDTRRRGVETRLFVPHWMILRW